jgi:uncharacterized protein (TIGR02231 family)
MVQKIILFISVLTATVSYSQDEKEISSDIKEVTVFLNGAEITRLADLTVQRGTNEIKLTDLSPFIQPNSIQVKSNNKAVTIVSVNHEINYLDRANLASSPKVKAVNDSIDVLELNLAIRQSYERVYNEEKSLLQTNKKLGGANTGVNIEDLMDAADFYRDRLINLETKLLDIQRNKKDLNASIARLKKQRSLYYNDVKNTGEVIVNLTSSVKATSKIEVSYIVDNAGWIPFYDIRSDDLEKPIDLTYKGRVYQKTGKDWDNVTIKLSTGNPTTDNTQPKFSKWYLEYYNNYTRGNGYAKKRKTMAYKSSPSAPQYESYGEEVLDEVEVLESSEFNNSESIADFTTVSQSNVSTIFDISLPYSVKSDGKANLIEIQKYELPVSYQYYAMPKQDKDAFLLANIVGWGDYNLLAGDANVYFENTFVGESYLETAITNDTLNISMGRDKGIVITREKIKDFCKNNTFGGNRKSTRGYEITVRNNKSTAVEIELIDQIPLSNQKEIEVEVLENEKATYDESTGKLTWRLSIPANSKKEVSFKFSVKYPKEKTINNL